MSIDFETLLQPISADQPSGEDPEYSQEFAGLKTLAVFKEEVRQKNSDGVEQVVKKAEEPNWNEVRKSAIGLLTKSKEITTALYLALALLKCEGFPGFREGLSLVHNLLDRFWDTIYPELDKEDNNDPTIRINTLANLGAKLGIDGDPFQFIYHLRSMPLSTSKRAGQFSFRDILLAKKGTASNAQEQLNMSVIEAAFKDSDPESIKTVLKAIVESINWVAKIESFVNERVDQDSSLSLTELTAILTQIKDCMGSPETLDETNDRKENDQAPQQEGDINNAKSTPEDINSIEDVKRSFRKIITYYQRNEPSSPVPLVIERAHKLVGKNFREIIKEIAAQVEPQVTQLFGLPENREGVNETDLEEKALDAGTKQSGGGLEKSEGINSTSEVKAIFEKIITFYAKREPSSPVLLLLNRAKRLIGKNFREIIEDISGQAQPQLNELFGPPEEDQTNENSETG